jgi:pyridoxine 4-dehydrogenase
MRAIAQERGKTVAQVALNWNLCKGFLVLVGTRTVEQARDSIGACSFRLSDSEILEIERAAKKAKKFIKNPQECE